MNTPPGLLAAACALWGAQTGNWLIAAAAAIVLEAPRVVALRWNIAQAHFNRLSDFCTVLILAVGGYLYATYGNPRALMLLFQWLPVLLLPLAAAQAWGNLREVDVAAFVWTLRRAKSEEHYALNLGYPCLAVWVVAGAAAHTGGPAFYLGLAALAGWALWSARPRRYPLVLWIALFVVTVGSGYGLQHGLYRAQAWLEEVIPEWIGGSGSRTDPYRSRTDLGHIGDLKQDDAIVLRVRPHGEHPRPLLLHRASYNNYFGGTWNARNAPLVARLPETGARWPLASAAPAQARVTVFDYSPRGNPVLSLPRGTVELDHLDALSLKQNVLGTVQAERPPGYFSYVAAAGSVGAIEAAPGEDDLRVPNNERRLFAEIVERLGLAGLPASEVADAVKRYFAAGFAYTTYQKAGTAGRSVLADFLLRSKAGHCEYYATATVLLLRAGGVPARYATGFSAQEYSRLEDAYIVRVRHAHAWVKAWVDGQWIEIDTTPAAWAAVEDRGASWWAPISDLWSWLRFKLSQLGASSDSEERTAAIAAVVALIVALWFGWRLYRQRGLMMFGRRSARESGSLRVEGADSELLLVEREIAKAGLGRNDGETTMAWIARVSGKLPDAGALARIAELHYRYRFDPLGLPAGERAQLRELALQWLAHWPRK
jgi:transglutaminase-like putative cysteine protease